MKTTTRALIRDVVYILPEDRAMAEVFPGV